MKTLFLSTLFALAATVSLNAHCGTCGTGGEHSHEKAACAADCSKECCAKKEKKECGKDCASDCKKSCDAKDAEKAKACPAGGCSGKKSSEA